MNYPKGMKPTSQTDIKKETNYGNRGMSLENDINDSNKYYIEKNIAFIYKKPTPIQITKVDYGKKGKVIKEAFFKEPSTTDYNGLYKGRYIDFEAKETNLTTSFPLHNIHPHQIRHIENIVNNGGIAFLIVRFSKKNENFILFGEDFLSYIKNNEKKSIPLSYFEEKGKKIEEKYIPRLDYLKIVDEYMEVFYG